MIEPPSNGPHYHTNSMGDNKWWRGGGCDLRFRPWQIAQCLDVLLPHLQHKLAEHIVMDMSG
jgi:hypothetical protein